jgi:hypothetical protein
LDRDAEYVGTFACTLAVQLQRIEPEPRARIQFLFGQLPMAVLVNLPMMALQSIWAIRDRYVSGRKAVAFEIEVRDGIAGLIARSFQGRNIQGYNRDRALQ